MKELKHLTRFLLLIACAGLLIGTASACNNFCIKGYVWEDADCDGLQECGENSLNGVTVKLYECGEYSAQTTTDCDGKYSFEGLSESSEYYVIFIVDDNCYCFTQKDVNNNGNDGIDSDVNCYGISDIIEGFDGCAVVDAGLCYCCVCEPRSPGYWKNHDWPEGIYGIEIGGVYYEEAEAKAIMSQSVEGDKAITMFKALAAAKLNVLNCAPRCIGGTIEEADEWMEGIEFKVECETVKQGKSGKVKEAYIVTNCNYKIEASSDAWKCGEPLYECLDAYNNGKY